MDVNNPADISRKRKLQMELIIKEGDYKKTEQKKHELEFEIRNMRKKMDLLNFDIEGNKKEVGRIESLQMEAMAEIKRLKKAMNEI